jgi:hypothetical protein
MPEIYPKMTHSKLKGGARKTSEGKGRVPLPSVKTDAKHVEATDKCGYQANRELAEMIKAAVRARKNSDRHGEHLCSAGGFIRTRIIPAGGQGCALVRVRVQRVMVGFFIIGRRTFCEIRHASEDQSPTEATVTAPENKEKES